MTSFPVVRSRLQSLPDGCMTSSEISEVPGSPASGLRLLYSGRQDSSGAEELS